MPAAAPPAPAHRRRTRALVAVVAALAVAAAVGAWSLRDRVAGDGGAPCRATRRADAGAAGGTASCAGRPASSAPGAARHVAHHGQQHRLAEPARAAGTRRCKAEYRGWLDLAERHNHNAIFVHVRPSGDAFWPSKYAPWSEWLTGRRDGA